MRRLYPKEAGPVMVSLLNDRNRLVAAQAAVYFCDEPDRSFASALLAVFRKISGIAAKRLGHALALMKDYRFLDAVREKHARIPGAATDDFAEVLMDVTLLGTDESQWRERLHTGAPGRDHEPRRCMVPGGCLYPQARQGAILHCPRQ